MMRWLSRRRLRKWNDRARPHLERFQRALSLTVTEENLIAIGDRFDAAADELADYMRSDPCPLPELAAAYATAVLIVTAVANVFAAWHVMAPVERRAAVERTRALMPDADRVGAVLEGFAPKPPSGPGCGFAPE